MSFYKVSALSVLAISLAACSSSGDKTDSQPTTTIPSATTGTTGSTNAGSTTNTGNTGTTTPTTPAPTTLATPVTQPTVLVPAPTAPTGKALEAANKAKTLSVPSIQGQSIIRPVNLDPNRTTAYTAADKLARTGDAVIASTKFKPGFSTTERQYDVILGEGLDNYHIRGTERVYNQNYSIVYGNLYDIAEHTYHPNLRYENGSFKVNNKFSIGGIFTVDEVAGQATEASQMPTLGKATYLGDAFSGKSNGRFEYAVDFGTRKGSGKISGLSEVSGDLILNTSDIKAATGGIGAKQSVSGDVAYSNSKIGTYSLGFYGPKAEEVAGRLEASETWPFYKGYKNSSKNIEIGFGGTRGAITK
ncbi:factor H binding protein domain-containing protein [uncultured Moraxella sp.]|uniref:factor H binding protein domain-containing protein n=1 Tax=uncultured Moraxella sp. TaxID=263769 RepID=UPI0025E6AD01|nr:factor H binding protein domain-containing protein [uncultured Moraxella sp.]